MNISTNSFVPLCWVKAGKAVGNPSPREQANIALLKRAYAVWHASKGQDASVWYSLVAPVFFMNLRSRGAEHVGFTAKIATHADLDRFFAELASNWSMNFYRVDRYVARGEVVVTIGECSFTNRKTGKAVITPKVDLYKFCNGMIVEVSEVYDTAEVAAAVALDSGLCT